LNHETESAIYFDSLLQDVLDKYIGGVYDAVGIAEFEKLMLEEINSTIKDGTNRTIPITDLRSFFCNVAFCWVVYHSHTFSNISLASYYRFKPSILRKEVPLDDKEWTAVNEREYLPPAKMLMETCKLNKAVTLRDSGNILTDKLARLSFKARKQKN
jgi:hypothetical protein